ncbi:MAG: Rieske 2Fe-2S domain-containing protein [Pyrinomonadaceae bacterium]|nr:Rieske 2Fe-2S domain-containing protein [Pyrinomonadaceae bacterium]
MSATCKNFIRVQATARRCETLARQGYENAERGTLYDRRSQRSGRSRFLTDGQLCGPTIECDWHGWRFDVRTGQCLNRAGSRIESYEVVIEDDWIKILI